MPSRLTKSGMLPDAPSQSAHLQRRVRRLLLILLSVFSLLFILALLVFLFVGDWLVSEDPLQKAQFIAVLSGGLPLRVLEAARLYHQGYAPKVLLTHPSEPAAAVQALGIPYLSEDDYDSQILIHEGVPKEAIEVLSPPIRNTADEIAVISGSLPRQPNQTVIIVTSKVHTRRSRILWQRLNHGPGHALIHGVSDDPFNPRHWWANTSDTLDVVREIMGVLNAWAGLPLRSSK
jgi:uncharacterized SAM-binding protein YcdF (DUF218 family)